MALSCNITQCGKVRARVANCISSQCHFTKSQAAYDYSSWRGSSYKDSTAVSLHPLMKLRSDHKTRVCQEAQVLLKGLHFLLGSSLLKRLAPMEHFHGCREHTNSNVGGSPATSSSHTAHCIYYHHTLYFSSERKHACHTSAHRAPKTSCIMALGSSKAYICVICVILYKIIWQLTWLLTSYIVNLLFCDQRGFAFLAMVGVLKVSLLVCLPPVNLTWHNKA